MNLIEIKNVTKGFQEKLFHRKIVLKNIDLIVKKGDFLVLRGANGVGKSLLIKIILGLQESDSGSVKLFGLSPKSPESKLQLGTVFQEVIPPNSLKVKELISLVRSYYPNPISTQEILETVGLTDQQNSFPKDLAGGQKQRLYFALALVGNPQLLVLDEPTKNLDVEGQEAFWQQIEQCKQKGVTILIVTHIKSEQDKLQDLATHIITLADGTLNYDKKPTQAIDTEEQVASFSHKSANLLSILFKQTWAEMLQILRNPLYLGGVFLFSGLAALLPSGDDDVKSLILFAAISLLLFSVDRLSKKIAIERVEGWLKLLRVTPLKPSLYITAKLIMALIILIITLATILCIGFFKMGISQSLFSWITLSASLLLGIVPFAVIGIALGYVIPPKALDPIAALLLPLGIFSSGVIPPNNLYIKDLIVISPFFHYSQVIQFFASINQQVDNHIFLSIIWLVFYTVIAGIIAKLAYQWDRFSQ